MHKVIDSPWRVGQHAAELKAGGVETIIRYYNHNNSTSLPQKRMEKDEYDEILAAGLSLAVVFQQRGGANGNIQDLTAATGARDGKRAVELARAYGQPQNSAIYFAVDDDYTAATDIASIIDYFKAVSKALKGLYRVGIYGSGKVAASVCDADAATFVWLAAGTGWAGTKDMLKTDQWSLYQFHPPQTYKGVVYDGNFVGGKWKDFGQFHKNPSAGEVMNLGPTPKLAAAVSVHSELVEVTASGGLHLRRGPGEVFGIEAVLPLGTRAVVLDRSGDWAKLDRNGDGTADGYVHTGFLKVLSGGFPLHTVAARSAYDIAQAELAKGMAEVPGPGNNPRIVMYHRSTNAWSGVDDGTAWCSSFVNFCVEQAGMSGTDSQNARSWQDWGRDATSDPTEGDIVVFARGKLDGTAGHVGFFVSDLGSTIKVLGGNQGHRICYKEYPKDGDLLGTRYKLLAIRRG